MIMDTVFMSGLLSVLWINISAYDDMANGEMDRHPSWFRPNAILPEKVGSPENP
jgi:hypothetical protein